MHQNFIPGHLRLLLYNNLKYSSQCSSVLLVRIVALVVCFSRSLSWWSHYTSSAAILQMILDIQKDTSNHLVDISPSTTTMEEFCKTTKQECCCNTYLQNDSFSLFPCFFKLLFIIFVASAFVKFSLKIFDDISGLPSPDFCQVCRPLKLYISHFGWEFFCIYLHIHFLHLC